MVRVAEEIDPARSAELDEIAERLVAWLKRHHGTAPISNESDRWATAMQYLASAEQLADRRALAGSRALMLLLGRTMDESNAAFRNAAAAVKMTRALANSVRFWRASPQICSAIDSLLRHHRDVMRHEFIAAASRARELPSWGGWTAWLAAALQKFIGAATRARELPPWWGWTAWLATAIANHSFVQPLAMARWIAPSREPWWQWTVWLCAAMNMRRRELLQHDIPERIQWAASVADDLDEIADLIMGALYVPDRDVLAGKRRRGRPTDHLRRQLYDILAEGGLTWREIADLIEDRAGPKMERLRGRRRRAEVTARANTRRSTTPRKSKRKRPR